MALACAISQCMIILSRERGQTKFDRRDWLQQIKLDWSAMSHWIRPSQGDQMVKTLMHKYAKAFKAELGIMKGVKAKLVVKAGAVLKFIRP